MSSYKSNRRISFAIIIAVYAAAIVMGIAVYRMLPFPFRAKDGFAEYKAETHALLPIKKHTHSAADQRAN